MRSTASKIRNAITVMIAVVVTTGGFDCPTDATGVAAPIQNCGSSADTDFPRNGTFSITKPAQCPYATNTALTFDYAAAGTVPIGSVTGYQYQLSFTTRTGGVVAAYYQSSWTYGSTWLINVTGQYPSAWGGFDSYNQGYDMANNQLYLNNHWTTYRNKLSYFFGLPSMSVAGPTGLGANIPYHLSASTNDPAYVAPVSWSWYVDGTLQYTGSPDFDWQTGPAGTTQSVRLNAVDGNGKTYNTYRDVPTCADPTVITC
jgi:hypothetical protein